MYFLELLVFIVCISCAKEKVVSHIKVEDVLRLILSVPAGLVQV